MAHEGGCQCGAVRYEVSGKPQHIILCHCEACRKSAGAPMVAWAAFAEDELTVLQGGARRFNSSGNTMRYFCETCGTGLFYRNEEFLPGIVDVQLTTLDDPAAYTPQAHIQTAERISWMADAHTLTAFERYPPT
jgi:hypothetical protein